MCEECIECQYVVVGLVAAEAACGTCGAMSFVALASHMRIVVCCSSVVQCGAVWCSVVQCVAVCCSVLQCVAVLRGTHITHAHCSVLQLACCSVLQLAVLAL